MNNREILSFIVRAVIGQDTDPDMILPIVPPSDNKRKTRTPQGRIVTNSPVKKFRKDVSNILGNRRLPAPPVVVLYRVFFKNARRDGQNCQKVLIDALYPQDKKVQPWALQSGVDKKNPRTELWFVDYTMETK